MDKTRVLYISQEIVPFLPETETSNISRKLPQGINEKGKEIRVFMPRYGKINERRHQLHEVIRLSGMNLIINDSDHPLIIKVASIPSARMQVYFIDNEEYFTRKSVLTDEKGAQFEDNDERSIFFIKGVLETVKKLGWAPDIIHCHGWMTALAPLYIKKVYNEDPHFADAKVIFTHYNEGFEGSLDNTLVDKMKYDGIDGDDSAVVSVPNHTNLNKLGAQHADANMIVGNIDEDLTSYIESLEKPLISVDGEEGFVSDVDQFYDTMTVGNAVMVEEE